MHYEDVRTRVKRISVAKEGDSEAKRRIVHSLLNQARLAEGEGAKKELERELSTLSQKSHNLPLTGAGNKQIGWGKGRRFGTGKWRYTKRGWEKID